MVKLLNYEEPDGTLRKWKVIMDLYNISAANSMIKYRVSAMMHLCLDNTTTANATEQFTAFQRCTEHTISDFCQDEKRIVEKFLARDSEPPLCEYSSYNAGGEELMKVLTECEEEMSKTPYEASSSPRDEECKWKTRFAQKDYEFNRQIERTSGIVMCYMNKTGSFSVERGQNYSRIKELLSPSLSEDPDLSNFTVFFKECEIELQGNAGIQGFLFEKCFTNMMVDLCGTGSVILVAVNGFHARHCHPALIGISEMPCEAIGIFNCLTTLPTTKLKNLIFQTKHYKYFYESLTVF
ncbi:hypothetical protein SK128_011944 [Halocaridina rubra]|uniref:Uncharacterized protein n=1 Tax=Halocaridina rubra TaxID=373956 RepID=A0AAN8XFB5_HALRR